MVFTTTNLFKGIACPEGEQCKLTSCIFSHDLRPQRGGVATAAVDTLGEPANKRRKITTDDTTGRPLSKFDQIREQLTAERSGGLAKHSLSSGLLPSLERPVTPPPTNGRKSTNKSSPDKAPVGNNEANIVTKTRDSEPKEDLNPRLIPKDPAGHAKRTLYLKHMHSDMVKLNQKVADAHELPNKHLLVLSEQELIKLALDEEESLARSQQNLYQNKMKQRIAAYKKMDTDGWISHVKIAVIEPRQKSTPKGDSDEKIITTGLSLDEEVLILPHLVADQTKLAPYGYIPSPPTEAQAAEARTAVEHSKNYENCDRCGSNFRVFPERNEEGLLTSNGPCKFHPNKKIYPQKTKNDYNAAAKEPYHPCCNNPAGSVGCTTHESHVFKISPDAPYRLAAVLPFITTPKNPSPKRDKRGKEVKAVSFDCEMGYTTCGMELIRLTAVSWPSGEELVDVLVKPVGTVIDLNSRFSGVFSEHFATAIPFEEWQSHFQPSSASPSDVNNSTKQILPVVDSIAAARALLTSYLTPATPLIGHAIDNDLNVTRLCHPTIIDTVLLFRHPRGGLPMRLALRALTLQYLGKRIQQGGERGHDSAEDARATGELVRVKVRERWAQMEKAGFAVKGGKMGRGDGKGGWKAVDGGEGGNSDIDGLASDSKRLLIGDGFGNGEKAGGGAGSGNSKKRKKNSKGHALGMDGAGDEESEGTEQEKESDAKARTGLAAVLPKE